MQAVEIPITENDLQNEFQDLVYNGKEFEWIFQDQDNNDVTIRFTKEEE